MTHDSTAKYDTGCCCGTPRNHVKSHLTHIRCFYGIPGVSAKAGFRPVYDVSVTRSVATISTFGLKCQIHWTQNRWSCRRCMETQHRDVDLDHHGRPYIPWHRNNSERVPNRMSNQMTPSRPSSTGNQLVDTKVKTVRHTQKLPCVQVHHMRKPISLTCTYNTRGRRVT